MANGGGDVRVGEFLLENRIITQDQLDEALAMQNDNPDRLIGEILVTQGVLTKEDLVMALEMYLMVTGSDVKHVDEWLDQEEVDMLMGRISDTSKNKSS